MAQSILTNTTIATTGRLINILLGVAVTALITRLLGPSQFGSYVLLLSIGALIQLTADFGLYLTLTRFVAQQPQQSSNLLSQIFSLRLFLLITVFMLSAIGSLIIPALRPFTLSFVIMAFGLSCQSFSQLLMGIYQHRQVVWRATLGDLVGRLAQIASILLIGAAATNVNSMITAFTVGAALAYLLHQWLLPVTPWRIVFAWSDWKKIIAVSWPLGAMLLVNAFYFRVDMLILSFFRPAWEVGWYGAAYRIIESALFFPAMLGGLLLPRISAALSRQAINQVNQYLVEGFRVLVALSLYGLLVLVFFSQPILFLVAGPTFAASAPLLQILSLALVIMFFGNLFGFALVAMGRQTFLLRLYLALAVFNACANFVFIPLYGAAAAAWTTVLTELIAAGSAAYFVHHLTDFTLPLSLVIKIILSFAGCAVFLFLLPPAIPSIIRILLLTGVYVIVILGASIISPAHLRLLRSGTIEPSPPPLH